MVRGYFEKAQEQNHSYYMLVETCLLLLNKKIISQLEMEFFGGDQELNR